MIAAEDRRTEEEKEIDYWLELLDWELILMESQKRWKMKKLKQE